MKKSFTCKLMFLFVFLTGTGIYAQTVNGIVSGEDGALPGVSVVEKGTSNGSTTDFDGNFSLSVSNSDAVLVFSYLGYQTVEMSASSSFMNITLLPDLDELDEVIIVGYGTQKREIGRAHV